MLKDKKGFTLIELMIVVAIIGILAAIAIPNFLKFQCKGRQSEAKTNLGGIFTAEKSFFSTYNEYSSSLPAINWTPNGCPRYVYGFSADNFEPSGGSNAEADAYIASIATTPNGNISDSAAGTGPGGAMVDTIGNPLYTPCWSTAVGADLGNLTAPAVGFTDPDGLVTPLVSAAGTPPGQHFIAGAVSIVLDGDGSNDGQIMNDYREVAMGATAGWGNDCAD